MGENKSLEKKLGVWGKDKIVREDKLLHAEDYYCVKCYAEKKEVPADSFFPIFDLDIPFYPYCNKHIDEIKIDFMLSSVGEIWAEDWKKTKIF